MFSSPGAIGHWWCALIPLFVALEPGALRAQTGDAAAARPPAVNRVNEYMPSWLHVRGEFRERVEGAAGAGFMEGRDDWYWLSRFRFDLVMRAGARWLVAAQAQDARVADKRIGGTGAPFSGGLDLRMAYVQYGGGENGPATLRAGRQELAFGDQRLVGHVSWLNTARTFDGARLTLRHRGLVLDGFATSLVRIRQGAFDTSGGGNVFAGAYASLSTVLPSSLVEPYVFWRADRGVLMERGEPGHLGAATVGARWVGRATRDLDYNVEMALQRGGVGSDTVRAWAGHWQVRTPAVGPAKLRVLSEYNYASGDSDPDDGRRQTFDPLYPTPHDKYGLADQVGWKNIHHARLGVDIGRWARWPMSVGYHAWWLAESRDALYGASGAPIARIAAGAADRFVGHEIDVQVTRAITPHLQAAAGLARIFPGGFLRDATPGATYSASFVSATYIFLADK